ncbi:MAG: transcription termination/antitermination NusG family protein [Phycisphaerae bacterium]
MIENPPVALPGTETLVDLAGRWWVGHTKSRFEKAFAWDLIHRGIGYFLPMVERVRISGGKKRRVMAPLFASYVFFCGSDEDRYEAMTTNRLCQTLDVLDQETLVHELVSIEKALAGKADLDPYPFAAVGQRCRIAAGPFMGLEGVVVQRNGMARLVLEVSMLGQGAALEIDASLLETVD